MKHFRLNPRKTSWMTMVPLVIVMVVIISFYGKTATKDVTATTEESNIESIQVPAINLSSDVAADAKMGLLFVYDGRIYTQTDSYSDNEAINQLVWEKLGYATGSLNEWSSQEEYAVEFAGTATGDVYKVQGYDPKFRLCITSSLFDGEKEVTIVDFYENLNGITVSSGKDLYQERLHLAGNWVTMQYQSHEDWNNGGSTYHDLTSKVTDQEINTFIDELYQGKFVAIEETDQDAFIFDEKQVHLYIEMKDGTKMELRLFEDGYVSYQKLGWYYVKMSGEVFDRVYQACQ